MMKVNKTCSDRERDRQIQNSRYSGVKVQGENQMEVWGCWIGVLKVYLFPSDFLESRIKQPLRKYFKIHVKIHFICYNIWHFVILSSYLRYKSVSENAFTIRFVYKWIQTVTEMDFTMVNLSTLF